MSALASGAPRDRPLPMRPRCEVSLSAFSFLFSEIVQYSQERSLSIDDMQDRLQSAGRGVGARVFELQCWREKQGKGDGKRLNRLIELLTFISTNLWKSLFGKPADSLERSTQASSEYMILEAEPITVSSRVSYTRSSTNPTLFGGF